MPTMPSFPDIPSFELAPREELFAGMHMDHWAPCWSPPRDAAAVIGPPGVGKTSGAFVPQLLWWSGSAITTSTRGDILHATGGHRARLAEATGGNIHVFDPFGTESAAGPWRTHWSPLVGATDAEVVYRRVSEMTAGAAAGMTDGQHWALGAASVLRPMLHAAALASRPITDVMSWLATHDTTTAADLIDAANTPARSWADDLRGVAVLGERERGTFFSTARGCLDVYSSPTAIASANTTAGGRTFDVDTFLATSSTLYIIGPPHHQRALAPIIVALVSAILERAWELAAEAGGVLQPRLLALLDELCNIAPLPVETVMGLVSAGGGSGITTSWGAQTMAHMRNRYGDDATAAILGSSGTKLIYGGLSPAADLEDISRWAGEHRETQVTVSSAGEGGADAGPAGGMGIGRRSDTNRSQQVSWTYRPVLPPEVIRQTQPGHAWLWHGPEPPMLVRTPPAGLVPAYTQTSGEPPDGGAVP